MTYNIPATLANVLVVAFAVAILLGIALGVYAARAYKKLEAQLATETETTTVAAADE